MLPDAVLEQVRTDVPSWDGRGFTAMEISHRSADFTALLDRMECDLRELMRIPDDYSVLFIQGGATLQFSMIPMNLLHQGESADYLTTGAWSQKAIKEARKASRGINEACNGESSNYMSLPERDSWQLDEKASYVHYVHNETISGLCFPEIPQVQAPLVADLSSCILATELDAGRFGIIYAGVQKNIGPPGMAVVVMAPEFLERSDKNLPDMLAYRAYARNRSVMNTPPTFTCYVTSLVLAWVKMQGGVSVMEKQNRDKSGQLYDFIDNSELYANPLLHGQRSLCNVAFTLQDPALEESFLAEAEQRGLINLRGHRSVGGMRASIYNAMPLEGVHALMEFMQDFEQRWQK